jgi:phosphoribosylformylglycinamidine synthase subunit PurS
MARVVVDVMPKPEILDPQGKAVTGALARLGFAGMSVRQGKRFEIELEGEVTEDRLEEVRRAAETLLANTVIETFDVRVDAPPESSPDDDEPDDDQIEPAEQSDQDEPTEQVELASTQAG